MHVDYVQDVISRYKGKEKTLPLGQVCHYDQFSLL